MAAVGMRQLCVRSLTWRAQVEPGVQKLFEYIYERGTIIPIEDYSAELLQHGDVSQLVTESIRAGTSDWEALVPRHVSEQVTVGALAIGPARLS